MRPNFSFLLAASNALLKPGGLLRWKVRLVKDARLLLPLTEVMKIARLTLLLLDAPRQSSPRPRLRHGRQLALLSHLNLTLNLCTLFFAISLALLPRLPLLLTSPTALLPGNRLQFMPLTCDPTFSFLSQRLCTAEPEATSLSSTEPRALWSPTRPFALLSLPLNFLRLPPTSLRPLPLAQTKLPIPCYSIFLALAWIFFFTSSISPGLRIPFLPIWKTSSIIPIHKMAKPLDSPASFRPISLTSCVSKLFERIILSRLLFFLEYNSILSPRQAGFRSGRSTLDQILFLFQSILNGFNEPRPGSRTILSTIDFSKTFDSVWHPALFHKRISAGPPLCFACWTQSFLSDRRACVVFQNPKSRSFRVPRGVPQGSVRGPALFSLFINDLPASLPSSVSCSLYADDLAIWSSSHSVPTAVEATQGALFRLERWSEYWCLSVNLSKCEASFFSVDPHQANLQPILLLLGSYFRFNPTPTFLGVTFDRTLSFSKHISSLKANFFPRLKALRYISVSPWGPSQVSVSLLYKAFLAPLLTYPSLKWFPFFNIINLTKLKRLYRAASCAIIGCL